MKLEPCPFCGSDDVEMLHHTGGYVTCYKCESSGPIYDALGEKWNSALRNITATLETSESGPMPWRLQIAASTASGWIGNSTMTFPSNTDAANTCLSFADTLIARHKATEAK